MAQLDTNQTNKIYRGTIDEVFSHRNEIPSGATVELKVIEEKPKVHEEAQAETPTMALMKSWLAEDALPDPKNAASIALLKSWLEEDATDDPDEMRQAEEELREFKRNMNLPRKETGARLHYPEVE